VEFTFCYFRPILLFINVIFFLDIASERMTRFDTLHSMVLSDSAKLLQCLTFARPPR